MLWMVSQISEFRLWVKTGGRFVEDQQTRLVKQGARDRDPLPLAARQAVAALADDLMQAVRQLLYKSPRAGGTKRGHHVLFRYSFLPQAHICKMVSWKA